MPLLLPFFLKIIWGVRTFEGLAERPEGFGFKCLTTLDLDFIFLEGISFDIKLQVVPFLSFLFFWDKRSQCFYNTDYNILLGKLQLTRKWFCRNLSCLLVV